MALSNFLFCFALLYSTSYCFVLPGGNQETFSGLRVAEPGLLGLCANAHRNVLNRKVICFLCYGWDPSCFHITTSTTSTVSPSSSSSSPTSPPTSSPSSVSGASAPQAPSSTPVAISEEEEEPESGGD